MTGTNDVNVLQFNVRHASFGSYDLMRIENYKKMLNNLSQLN